MTVMELVQLSALWEFLSQTLKIVEITAQKAESGDVEAARLIFELVGLIPTGEGGKIEQMFISKSTNRTTSCGDSRKETTGADRTSP